MDAKSGSRECFESARDGYEDIVLMASDPKLPFAWTALTVPEHNYVWFALKDPRVLPSTLFWISNGGRHYAPWNGRHRRAIGLEEVVSNFHSGLAESAKPNALVSHAKRNWLGWFRTFAKVRVKTNSETMTKTQSTQTTSTAPVK